MRALYLFILLFVFSCKGPADNKNIQSPRLIAQVIARSVKYKSAIDTLLEQGQGRVLLFAKVKGDSEIILVDDGEWPDDTEINYNVFIDSADRVIRIALAPVSAGIDQDVQCIHYFDIAGKIIAYEKRAGAFVLPNDGMAFETVTDYYDETFKKLKRNYNLVDKRDKALDKSKYGFNYAGIDTVTHSNVAECMGAYGIKL